MTTTPKILVLEDNDFVRMQIVKFLQDGGYEAVQADNVADVYEILAPEHHGIECALVDVRMEPDDGFTFIQKIEANNRRVPVILVTGDQNHDILSQASHLGVSSVLMKPVNKDRLVKMVERTIAAQGRKS